MRKLLFIWMVLVGIVMTSCGGEENASEEQEEQEEQEDKKSSKTEICDCVTLGMGSMSENADADLILKCNELAKEMGEAAFAQEIMQCAGVDEAMKKAQEIQDKAEDVQDEVSTSASSETEGMETSDIECDELIDKYRKLRKDLAAMKSDIQDNPQDPDVVTDYQKLAQEFMSFSAHMTSTECFKKQSFQDKMEAVDDEFEDN